MNRRAFLAALGSVATQRKLPSWKFTQDALDPGDNPPPPSFTVTRFPYLQNVRTDRASLLWATLESGLGQVKYTSDGVNFGVVTAKSRLYTSAETGLPNNYVQYQADLTDLSSGTDYAYAVTVDGQDIGSAGESRLHTAAPGPFRFVVVGDSGWGDPLATGQALVADKISKEKAALVIHTGDLVYNPSGTYDSYQRNYFNYFAPTMCSVPFFPSPGNHDYDVPNALPYLAIHSVPTEGVPVADRGRYYSFDWGNVHFVSIDAHQSLDRAVNSNGPMLKWLENDLRSTRQFWRIIYFHYPPYATGQNLNDSQCSWARTYMVPIFEQYGVQVVFSGHEHSYQRLVPIRKSTTVPSGVGTNYFVSGGGGAVLYGVGSPPMVAIAKSNYHYIRVDVQGTQMSLRSIRQDGADLDAYTIAPVPVLSDDPSVQPVTLNPGPVAGATIRIIGRGLAAEESFLCTPTPVTQMAGTVVTVNGVPVQLLYVSPTQIYALLPFSVSGNVTVRVTTANGFVDRSV
jgi:acid phosphatase type 7